MNDEDLFIALVIAATASGHGDPVGKADEVLRTIKQLRIIREGKPA